MNGTTVEFSHVYKTYPGPIHALRDMSFSVGKGELIFLTGPSGAGKTTLFRMLSAYDQPTSGRIRVSGYDLNTIKKSQICYFRRKIGVIFQDFKLLKDRTLMENVALPLEILGEGPQIIERKCREILDQVGLSFKKDHYPDQVSGGEQQRTAIARALVHRPELVVADEPTGNLDPQLSEEIMDIFEILNARGTTVFIATHDHGLVERRARRQLDLKAGQVHSDI